VEHLDQEFHLILVQKLSHPLEGRKLNYHLLFHKIALTITQENFKPPKNLMELQHQLKKTKLLWLIQGDQVHFMRAH
jgi:hypothetical protein